MKIEGIPMQVKEGGALRVSFDEAVNGEQKQENIQEGKDNLFFHIQECINNRTFFNRDPFMKQRIEFTFDDTFVFLFA